MLRYIFTLLLLFIIPAKAEVLTIVLPVAEDAHAINARIFSKYLIKHSKNFTSVEFKVVPGAASVVAANYIYDIAPKDGSTIGVFYKNIPLVGAIGGNNINFDPVKFTWLGSTADGRKDAVLLLSNKNYDNELIIGSDNVIVGDPIKFIKMSTNLKLKQVIGYKSQSEIRLALERGEVDAMVNSMIGIKTTKPEWLKPDSKIKPIIQFGNGLNRHPDFPNVITLSEIISEEYKSLLEIFETQYILLRPYVAPPNIPKEKAASLRKTFKAAASDIGYEKEASVSNIDVNPIFWEEAERIVNITNKNLLKVLN